MIWTKDAARTAGLAARKQLSNGARRRYSTAICRKLIVYATTTNARTIALYRATAYEVDLIDLSQWGVENNRQIFYPVTQNDGRMHFVRVDEHTKWSIGRHQIREPICADRFNRRRVENPVFDMICAPLSAFDAHFNRIGMGGGYYDRYVSLRRASKRNNYFGIAFECQRLSRIAVDEHDIALDFVATEQRLQSALTAHIKCKNSE